MASTSDRDLLDLAGFGLAHALWSIDGGEPLCTLAVAEPRRGADPLQASRPVSAQHTLGAGRGGAPRTLLRFAADTIQGSIDEAKALLAEMPRVCRAVIVWDGYLHRAGQRVDALFGELTGPTIERRVHVAQPYRPGTDDAVVVGALGDPVLVEDGQIVPWEAGAMEAVMEGMSSHDKLRNQDKQAA